jgi:hypothetical protein
LYIIKRISLAYYRIKPRWRETGPNLKTPPATEALRVVTPKGTLGYIDVYELDFPFVEYIKRLNVSAGSTKPWEYISRPNAGIFNYTRKPDGSMDIEWYENGRKPVLNTVGFDGNIVNVTEIKGKIGLIEAIDVNKYVPLYTYLERPDLVHQFTAVTKHGRLYKAGNGITVYVPLLTRFQSALPLEILEPFPTLPMYVKVEWASGLNRRKSPSVNSEKLNAFPQGRQLLVKEYRPRGAEVWGKMNGGFICLYTPTLQNPYSTSWKMVTSPPPQ